MTRFTGVWPLIRHILRRDRVWLPVWIVSLLGMVYASAGAVIGLYDNPVSIATYRATVGASAATIAMNGPATGLDTIGGIALYETSLITVVGIALMVIFTTVRHTRADEEAGRLELVGATRIGRQAPLLAAALVSSAGAIVVGAGVTLSFLLVGISDAGSTVYGAATACIGLVFTATTLVAAQVTQHGRAAVGLGIVLFGAAFLVRAVGDVNDSWVSYLSPIGWSQHVKAFAGNDWRPLLLSVVATLVLLVLAGWLNARRDLGAGMVEPRLGRREGSAALATPFGLALRVQRGTILGWVAGMGLLGVVYGSLIQEVADVLSSNPDIAALVPELTGADLVDAYVALIVSMSAMIGTGFTVTSVLRLKTDEDKLLLDQMLATPLSRVRWSLGGLTVTALGTVLMLTVFGVGFAISAVAVSSQQVPVADLFWATMAYTPACLLLGSIAFAIFGWLPRAAPLGWLALVVVFVDAWLGQLLKFPQWLIDLSPFAMTPAMPVESLTATPLVQLSAVLAGFLLVGWFGLRYRDVGRA